MLSSALTLSLILSLCFMLALSLPLDNNYGLSTSKHFSTHQNDLVLNRKKRSLPLGRAIARSRRKRQIVEGNDERENVGSEDEINDELEELNDEELAILARIVQDELDRYNPDVPVEDYRVVKLPRSLTANPVAQYIGDVTDNGNKYALLSDGQSKIIRPVIELPDDEIYELKSERMEAPEYMLLPAEEVIAVPNGVMEEEVIPIDEDALDDLELRARVAVLANALNERATRGL